MRTSRALLLSLRRAAGFEVESGRETKPGTSDKDVLDEADNGNRVLITEDRDFGELVIRQRLKVRGIILLELIACRVRRKPSW